MNNTPRSASELLRAARRRSYDDDSNQPPTPKPNYFYPNVTAIKSSFQNKLQKPILNYTSDVYNETEQLAYDTGKTIFTWIFRIFAFLFILAMTISIAFSMYCFMYWIIIPTKEYSWRLQFDYGTPPPMTTAIATTSSNSVSGSAPLASVNILDTHREQWNVTNLGVPIPSVGTRLLSRGLGYTVTVRLVLPESPTNIYRPVGGALMLNVELLNKESNVLARSNRPVLMKYRSLPVKLARWAALTPLYVLGIMDETQTHTFVLFESYVESQKHPLTNIRVWLSDPAIQITNADIFVIAELQGLAYWMYHWFFLSATIGTFGCWMFVVVLGLMSWFCCCNKLLGNEDDDVEDVEDVEDDDMEDEDFNFNDERRASRARKRTPINENDWRGREYVPAEDRGMKEE